MKLSISKTKINKVSSFSKLLNKGAVNNIKPQLNMNKLFKESLNKQEEITPVSFRENVSNYFRMNNKINRNNSKLNIKPFKPIIPYEPCLTIATEKHSNSKGKKLRFLPKTNMPKKNNYLQTENNSINKILSNLKNFALKPKQNKQIKPAAVFAGQNKPQSKSKNSKNKKLKQSFSNSQYNFYRAKDRIDLDKLLSKTFYKTKEMRSKSKMYKDKSVSKSKNDVSKGKTARINTGYKGYKSDNNGNKGKTCRLNASSSTKNIASSSGRTALKKNKSYIKIRSPFQPGKNCYLNYLNLAQNNKITLNSNYSNCSFSKNLSKKSVKTQRMIKKNSFYLKLCDKMECGKMLLNDIYPITTRNDHQIKERSYKYQSSSKASFKDSFSKNKSSQFLFIISFTLLLSSLPTASEPL